MQSLFIFKLAISFSVLLFFVPRHGKITFSLFLNGVIALCTTWWAVEAWRSDGPLSLDLGIPFWGGSPVFVIDKLSSFFILLINSTVLLGAVYGSGYLKPYLEKKSALSISIHLWAFQMLHVSMLHVVMMREGFAFLMAWEMMSVSSFLLVIFEGEKERTLKTGITYLVQMHAGFILLLIGLLWVSNVTGVFGFNGLNSFFTTYSNWPIFTLLFMGFGIKAGFIPFHTWLPHAHPAAPSHVSGIMSGIMIKMGIYGILRVLTFVQRDFLVIGIIVISLSIITGILGIVYASIQHDLKKLLAYSSIENIGIIGIGLGISLLGKYFSNETFIVLGLVSSLVHVLNHSLYKPLLFYTAGNVYYATHTRNMNKLGGIIHTMPVSGAFFLTGAIAISAIPPLNGFISEFLIYNGIFQSLGQSDFETSMLSLATILTLVIIGGLSLYTFTKAFGLTFLGSRRDTHAHQPTEVPWIMRVSGTLLIGGILMVALAATPLVKEIGAITSEFQQLVTTHAPVTDILPSLRVISILNFVALVVLGGFFFVRKVINQTKTNALGPTWGCGYSAGDFRHQYTPTSYANYVRELAGPIVDMKDQYHSFGEAEVFPGVRQFVTSTHDPFEEKLVVKPINSGINRLTKVGWAQTGKINHYLVYPLAFLILIGLLTLFGVL